MVNKNITQLQELALKEKQQGTSFAQKQVELPEAPVPAQQIDKGIFEGFTKAASVFWDENTVLAATKYVQERGLYNDINPDFNPFPYIPDDKLDYVDEYKYANSPKEIETISNRIDKQLENNRLIQEEVGIGAAILAGIAVGVADPVNLIPIGGPIYKSFKLGKVAQGAVNAAKGGFVAGVASEAVLQATQETRTLEESVVNIGASTMLSAIIGAGAAKLSDVEFKGLAKKFQKDMGRAESQIKIDEGGNLSAAKVPDNTLNDPDLKGGIITQSVIQSTKKLNPMLRVLTGSSKQAKKLLPEIVRTNMYTKANFNAIATRQSAEIEIKSYDAKLGKSIEYGFKQFDNYAKRIKQGKLKTVFKVGISDFYDQVSLAMIKGDISDIPEVQKTAQFFRKNLFDPLKEEAIKVGILSPDVDVKTATSYLMRMYNHKKIIGKQKEFKDLIFRAAKNKLIPELKVKLPKKLKTPKDVEKAIEKIDSKLIKTKENSEAYNKLIDEKLSLLIAKGDEQAIDDYAERIADSVYDNIIGVDRNTTTLPYDTKIIARGPAKERTLTFVSDEELRPFLETDITQIAKAYNKVMATDIVLKRKFGDVNLEPQIKEVQNEYSELIAKAKTEKQAIKLQKEQEETIRILKALKDILRGNYGRPENPDSFLVKAGQISRMHNYVTKLGGVTISSFTDVARPIMVHGMERVFGKGLKNLVANLEGIKLSVKDAKEAGQLFEAITHHRAYALADMGNPYSSASNFEMAVDTLATNFSKANLLDFWNNYQKAFASVVTQQRLLDNIQNFSKLKKNEKAYMALLGIDASNIGKLQEQVSKFSFKSENMPIANLEKWTDEEALRLYKNALNTDVDRTIVTKGAGDVPLLQNTELGKTILQFKSFAFAANQQVLIAGLQQADAAALSGIITALTAGMLVYHLKAKIAGRETSDNPKILISEALDRSGLLPILMEMNGVADMMGVGVSSITGSQPLSRYASRNKYSSLFGPTFGGTGMDAIIISQALAKGEITESDAKAIRRNIPAQNLFYIRGLFDELEKKMAQ